ncbi:type II secretion system protein [Vibrio comitans]|nr:type II secretion system protein [Vibrio comitans]
MNKQSGFTLIELVVVIVILGILAVTAAPRFLNLQSDARVSALQGVVGAINDANHIVYGKAAIEGEENTPDWRHKDIGPEGVRIHYGYMDTHSPTLTYFVQLSEDEFNLDRQDNGQEVEGPVIRISLKDQPNNECFVEYQRTNVRGELPTVTKVLDGC